MKNPIKKILASIILLTAFSLAVKAQSTNVSGGIYSNTTWTLANSPYIVTDTVVVFPGVTLTIEPGVVVKFDDDVRLEIRQASIIAQGTVADSITFTSNAASPTAGIWSEILLNDCPNITFNHCSFRYATTAIRSYNVSVNGILIVKNSNFNNNSYGIDRAGNNDEILVDTCNFNNNIIYGIGSDSQFGGIINYCNFTFNQIGIQRFGDGANYSSIIKNCTLKQNNMGIFSLWRARVENCTINNNNQDGISDNAESTIINCIIDSNDIGVVLADSILNCEIKYNNIGISVLHGGSIIKNIIEDNNIGIKKFYGSQGSILCNKICNNTSYDFYYNVTQGSNISIPNNYWCSTDSATIASHIYDGYDNINLGLVNFMPIDTLSCYLITENPRNYFEPFSFNVYPNPAFDNLTLKFTQNTPKATIKIYNLLGELKSTSMISHQEAKINISDLSNGLYILEAATENGIMRQKFIKRY